MSFDLFFDRWITGAILLGLGLWVAVIPSGMSNIRGYFRKRDLTPDVCAAIERRQQLEAIPSLAWRVPGLIILVLGAAVLAGFMYGVVGYSIGVCALAVSACITYVRMRNRGATRAALLRPRSVGTVIPLWHYGVAAIVGFAPLLLLRVPGYAAASIAVCLASLTTTAVALASNNMPSLMSGEDPQAELLVDLRLRRSRVTGLFVLGITIPFVFLSLNASHARDSLAGIITYLVVDFVWIALTIPKLLRNTGWIDSGREALQ